MAANCQKQVRRIQVMIPTVAAATVPKALLPPRAEVLKNLAAREHRRHSMDGGNRRPFRLIMDTCRRQERPQSGWSAPRKSDDLPAAARIGRGSFSQSAQSTLP